MRFSEGARRPPSPLQTVGLALLLSLCFAPFPVEGCGYDATPPDYDHVRFPYLVPGVGSYGFVPAAGISRHKSIKQQVARLFFAKEFDVAEAPREVKEPGLDYDEYLARVRQLAPRAVPQLAATRLRTGPYSRLAACNLESMNAFLDGLDADAKLKGQPDLMGRLVALRHEVGDVGCSMPDDARAEELLGRLANLESNALASSAASYLSGAHHFYGHDYERAQVVFEDLSETGTPWFAETAQYMTARSLLVGAQARWPNSYRLTPEERQENALRRAAGISRAQAAFERYLERYPDGRYKASAVGLRRFVYRILGEQEPLDEELRQLFDRVESQTGELSGSSARASLDEIITYYRGAGSIPYDEPLLLLFALLSTADIERFSWQAIEEQRAAYAPYPGLYDYVRAAYLALRREPERLVAFEPQEGDAEPLSRGTTAIRAHGFEVLGQYEAAAELWRGLGLRTEAADDASAFINARLVENYLKLGKPLAALRDAGFAQPSGLSHVLVHNVLTEDQLRELRTDEALAPEVRGGIGHALMLWLLMKEDYAGFLKIYGETEDVGEFSQVETAARTLLSHREDPKGLLNVGYFLMHWRKTPVGWGAALAFEPYRKKRLESARDFRGPRGYFRQVIEQLKDESPSVVEAKALHYAVQCGRTRYAGLWENQASLEEPKAWFARLHRKYSGSDWAERTPYYYE